ncbi:helix-turn-helix domain-containing protein [Sporomusa sphaeroides]|uniref:Helix-turn-helix domain protein n=1 Tax=Sporomusa sphaeroides DSM 2875 TaxID=1337886 RepID=A0ABP2C110_9FIRM|nr:helix-turn-helix domain-containing protein [Sporomusa sphaeroides]OLS58263.1 helix-turn-helix domain protein [Sporomusa sphaeroides DSM 2875]CVK17550.1 Helix-turn-helix domain protein [Sporomusa sphaeroides DSM 2875]
MKTTQKLFTLDAEKGTIIELSIEQVKEIVARNEKQDITKKAYSPEEARKIIGLGRNTFMELLHSGKIKGIKAGAKWLVPNWAIDEFLQAK